MAVSRDRYPHPNGYSPGDGDQWVDTLHKLHQNGVISRRTVRQELSDYESNIAMMGNNENEYIEALQVENAKSELDKVQFVLEQKKMILSGEGYKATEVEPSEAERWEQELAGRRNLPKAGYMNPGDIPESLFNPLKREVPYQLRGREESWKAYCAKKAAEGALPPEGVPAPPRLIHMPHLQDIEYVPSPPPPPIGMNPGKNSLTGEVVGDKKQRSGTPLPPFYTLFQHLPRRLFERYLNWCMKTEYRWNV